MLRIDQVLVLCVLLTLMPCTTQLTRVTRWQGSICSVLYSIYTTEEGFIGVERLVNLEQYAAFFVCSIICLLPCHTWCGNEPLLFHRQDIESKECRVILLFDVYMYIRKETGYSGIYERD